MEFGLFYRYFGALFMQSLEKVKLCSSVLVIVLVDRASEDTRRDVAALNVGK